jgi:hypothetical protein
LHSGTVSIDGSGMARPTKLEKSLRALDEFRRELSSTPPEALDCQRLEREVQSLVHTLGRELMVEVLQRADAKAPVVTVGGEQWGNRRETRGTYTTVFGDVEFDRATYQKGGGGRVVVPVELRLGIVEKRYTPQAARILTRAIALMSAEEASELLAEAGVAAVSKATLHRLPQAIAARYEQQREQINRELREADTVPDAAVTVQVSMDGVMVPQDGEHAKPRGRKVTVSQPPRHEQRHGVVNGDAPANDDNLSGRAWHEACVGTLSFWDADGDHLKTIYVARMPESGKATVAGELEDELQAALCERPDLKICFAADGNPTQWELLEAMGARLPAEVQDEPVSLLDFYHCAAYLESAANAVHPESPANARILAKDWGEQLKELDDGSLRVLKAMRYQRDSLPAGTAWNAIEKSIKFLANQAKRGRLGYAQARRQNRPIGTGVVEAAAKTIVNVRMKRAGARYSQHGGQTIMLFRTAILSQRFEGLSSCLHRTYQAAVRSVA